MLFLENCALQPLNLNVRFHGDSAMPRFAAVVFALSFLSSLCFAGEGEDQANSFASIYATLCMKNLNNLEALREKLSAIPKLPAEKAAHFLLAMRVMPGRFQISTGPLFLPCLMTRIFAWCMCEGQIPRRQNSSLLI